MFSARIAIRLPFRLIRLSLRFPGSLCEEGAHQRLQHLAAASGTLVLSALPLSHRQDHRDFLLALLAEEFVVGHGRSSFFLYGTFCFSSSTCTRSPSRLTRSPSGPSGPAASKAPLTASSVSTGSPPNSSSTSPMRRPAFSARLRASTAATAGGPGGRPL